MIYPSQQPAQSFFFLMCIDIKVSDHLDQFWPVIWVLRIEPRSSGRTAELLSAEPTLQQPYHTFLHFQQAGSSQLSSGWFLWAMYPKYMVSWAIGFYNHLILVRNQEQWQYYLGRLTICQHNTKLTIVAQFRHWQTVKKNWINLPTNQYMYGYTR